MLLKELKDLLKNYKEEELRSLIAEIYKLIPKKVKEEKEIDSLIEGLGSFKKKDKKEAYKHIDIDELKDKIDLFVKYAYEQYYFAPNRYVSKKERPKWRFTVKAFINDLQKFPGDSRDGIIATQLLDKIYRMLSHACGYYLFNTENPFSSVGIYQEELLDITIKRMFSAGINPETIKDSIKLSLSGYAARDSLSDYLARIPGLNLETNDARNMAIEQGEIIRKEMLVEKKMKKPNSHDDFWHGSRINNLVRATTMIYMDLCEYENAIIYFTKNYSEKKKEILIYVLLDIFKRFENIKYWKKIYEDAVLKKIELREYIVEEYEYLVKNDEFRH